MSRLGLSWALVSLACGIIAATPGRAAPAAPDWTEGRNYFLVERPHPPSLPKGKVEVIEVFSYACPACNAFLPFMRKLIKSLPANAVVDYLPAAFNANED